MFINLWIYALVIQFSMYSQVPPIRVETFQHERICVDAKDFYHREFGIPYSDMTCVKDT